VSKTPGVFALAAFACAGLLAGPSAPVRAAVPPVTAQSDLDAFMQKVLAQRDQNWTKLQQYILDEREQVEVRGPSRIPIWGEHRDFSWYIRDGYFIKSPTKVNGVTVPEDERKKYEADFLKRMQARDRQAQRGRGAAPPPDASTGQPPRDMDAFVRQTRQPGFIDSAYFLRFKFEQGKYALVGHEAFDGLDVLRIEYYPARLFTHEQDQQTRRDARGQQNRNEDMDAAVERMMNKVSLVTIWVEPKANQIVKYTFDNVSFDFLPAAWFVRVTDLKASMTMSQPFKDVWLPRDVDMYFAGMLAIGAIDLRYHLDYHDYKQASTSGRIKLPEGR
jgi:hypothetical protein